MSYKNNNIRAYASNHHASEEDLIYCLNQHFQVLVNNIKNGNVAAVNNSRLPGVMVQKFKVLHQLCNEINGVRGRSIERQMFDDVFSSITHTFGNDPTNPPTRYLRLYDEFAEMADPSRKRRKNESHIYGRSSSDDTNNKELFIGKFDGSCFEVVNDMIRCTLCDTKLKCISTFVSHMNGASHKEAIGRFGWSWKYVEEINQQTLLCSLCNVKFARLALFVEHCDEYGHQAKLRKIENTYKERNFFKNEMFIDVTKYKFQCPICYCATSGIYQLFGHLRSRHELEITREERYEDAKYLADGDDEWYEDDESSSYIGTPGLDRLKCE